LKNHDYARRTLPFLKDEYFLAEDDRIFFQVVRDFIVKYDVPPTVEAVSLEVNNKSGLRDEVVKTINQSLKDVDLKTKDNIDWLIQSTEKFCQEKAIYLAIMKSIEIMDGKNNSNSKGAIPQLLSDALAVTFDPNVGHDYLEDYQHRFEYYHRKEEKIPFDLEFFNKITNGGASKKTLNIFMGGPGAGKSLIMGHIAASYLNQGKKVLYITLELAQEEIAKRIDANMMNIHLDDLMKLSHDMYEKRIKSLKAKTNGQLIIKEYPTASASSIHFKALLNELRLKKNFVPDAIFVDYINLCLSARVRMGAGVNSYTYIKMISEELRGMAVEYNVPLWTATQVNREGFKSSDFGMGDTSESFGLPATADLFLAILQSDQMKALNQVTIKQLKNRYNSIDLNSKFVVGMDKPKFKLYDAEASAQDLVDDGQEEDISTFDKTSFAGNGNQRFSVLKVT
jgi:archaellum biogenesis ATPase FlaH